MGEDKNAEGLMSVLEGLLKGVEDAFGKDRARDIAHRAGYEAGERFGRKLGHLKPEDAIKKLAGSLPICRIKIVDINKKSDALEIAAQFENCAVLKMLETHALPYPSVACKFIEGYIEGALNAMTGMKAKNLVYESSISKSCIGTITLEKR